MRRSTSRASGQFYSATAWAACWPLPSRRHGTAGLALLATPWDFHAEAFSPVLFAERVLPLTASVAGLGFAPVELLQAFFA